MTEVTTTLNSTILNNSGKLWHPCLVYENVYYFTIKILDVSV